MNIKSRVRFAILLLFLVILPLFFVSVLKTQKVGYHSTLLYEYEDFARKTVEIKLMLKELSLALVIFNQEKEIENGHNLVEGSQKLKFAIKVLMSQYPKELGIVSKNYIESMALRLDGLIKRSLANMSSMAPARLHLLNMEKEIENIEKKTSELIYNEKQSALGSILVVGRDQLILFLILFFSFPIFLWFIPYWVSYPLSKLKQLAIKMQAGRFKEIDLTGKDELSLLSKTIHSYLLKQEELDQKKSSKVFEMRNLLRATINRVNEPIFIIDRTTRVNYTNEAASLIVGLPPHQIEGQNILECIYSSVLKKYIEKALLGDITEDKIFLEIETNDNRNLEVNAKVGMVRNRDGDVSRVVVVLV